MGAGYSETAEQTLEGLPLMTAGRLREEDEAFVVTALLRRGQGTFTTATAWWPKTTFDRWWAGGRAFAVALASPTLGTFESVTVKAAASCAPDSWTPVGRSAAAAVWTGIEMIVWGGTNGNGPIVLNDGARYNPSTDRTPARRSCSSSAGARRIGGRVRVSGKPLPFQTVPVSGPFQEGFI
jgi:hypothetical protein